MGLTDTQIKALEAEDTRLAVVYKEGRLPEYYSPYWAIKWISEHHEDFKGCLNKFHGSNPEIRMAEIIAMKLRKSLNARGVKAQQDMLPQGWIKAVKDD